MDQLLGSPTTETLDRIYLEWSQFTRARTKRDLALQAIIAHWDEFGPEHGFEEVIERARGALVA